jgi:hypothetical protein
MGQDIIVQFKDHHFLVGDGSFVITFSDLYDLFTLDALDIPLMRFFALYVRKTSFFNICVICF